MYKILPLIFSAMQFLDFNPSAQGNLRTKHTLKILWHQFKPLNHKSKAGSQFWTQYSQSRRDEEEGGELDSHEEARHFRGSRRDEEEGGELDPQVSPEEIKSREVVLDE